MRALALIAALAGAVPAEATIRAVFVGVDKYRYSAPKIEEARFKDLRGAVRDVGTMKAALRTAYNLDLDAGGTDCRSANAVSVTLTDSCADRAAILAALDERIAASAPGDTVVFYFAGHGSTIVDGQVFDQASGRDATIMPHDARNPEGGPPTDILDREIHAIKERAVRRGVHFVTIFDSCHSESAARDAMADGEARSAPELRVTGFRLPAVAPAGGGGSLGYAVHLAASREDEQAREVGVGETRSGVFTTALAATLLTNPAATFEDIVNETRRKVEASGNSAQSPRANGAMTARLGGDASAVRLLRAEPAAGGAVLQAGLTSGVSEGSRFALFASATEAVATDGKPLVMATVGEVGTARASLALDTPVVLPRIVHARETQHAYGTRQLLVRNAVTEPGVRAAVSAAIAASDAGREGEPAQLVVRGSGGSIGLWTVGGAPVDERLVPPGDRRFGALLTDGLVKVSRVNDLLGLRTDPATAALSFCVSNMVYEVRSCPPVPPGGRPRLVTGKEINLTVINSRAKRHLYVFSIDDRYQVDLIIPTDHGVDPPVDASQPVTARPIPETPGHYRFVTIASDAPIAASAFEQSAIGARGGTCRTALERALCAALSGRRDPSAPKVGDWTAIVTDVDVVKE